MANTQRFDKTKTFMDKKPLQNQKTLLSSKSHSTLPNNTIPSNLTKSTTMKPLGKLEPILKKPKTITFADEPFEIDMPKPE
jgi:hypothetical protein